MVHIHSGILLTHNKEWNNAICSNMDGPKDYHTKWSKSEKDKFHMISLICGILKKKWYKWTYLQNRMTVTELENELMVTKGDGWGSGIDWEFGIDMYTLLYLK